MPSAQAEVIFCEHRQAPQRPQSGASAVPVSPTLSNPVCLLLSCHQPQQREHGQHGFHDVLLRACLGEAGTLLSLLNCYKTTQWMAPLSSTGGFQPLSWRSEVGRVLQSSPLLLPTRLHSQGPMLF